MLFRLLIAEVGEELKEIWTRMNFEDERNANAYLTVFIIVIECKNVFMYKVLNS